MWDETFSGVGTSKSLKSYVGNATVNLKFDPETASKCSLNPLFHSQGSIVTADQGWGWSVQRWKHQSHDWGADSQTKGFLRRQTCLFMTRNHCGRCTVQFQKYRKKLKTLWRGLHARWQGCRMNGGPPTHPVLPIPDRDLVVVDNCWGRPDLSRLPPLHSSTSPGQCTALQLFFCGNDVWSVVYGASMLLELLPWGEMGHSWEKRKP